MKDLTSIEGYDQNQVIEILQTDACNARQTKRKNQLRLVLKNKLWQLANYCLQDDPSNSGKISVEQINKAIVNLGLNENILTEEDKNYFINSYKLEGEDQVNYGKFIKDLKEFQYNPDDIYVIFPQKQELVDQKKRFSQAQLQSQLEMYDSIAQERYNWKSLQAQPVNKLFTIMKSAQTAIRKMVNKKVNKAVFEEYLQEYSKVSKEQFEKEHTISYEELSNAFKQFFQKKEIELDQQNFDGLMAFFVYNQYGFTKTSEIPKLLFTESQKDYLKRVSDQYQHGPPPPMEERDFHKQFNQQSQSLDNINLQKVLGKIENRVFDRKVESFKLFKQFDVDGDGYVSIKDAKKKLQQLNFLNEAEIQKFVNYLDKEKKSYLTFDEFSQVVKPNMGNLDSNGNLIQLPNTQPTKEVHERNVRQASSVFEFIKKGRDHFRAESCEPKTRFGKTPAWKNTFINFQAQENSGQYISEKDRLGVSHQSKVQYQIDERNLKQQRDLNKLTKCKEFKEFQLSQIETGQKLQELRKINKYKQKGLVQWAYEHQCHLQNQLI